MCFTCSILVDQTQKIFLSVLVVFGKYFVFAKMSKISKTVLPYSGDLVAGKPSHMPPVVSLLSRFMQLSSGSRLQSQKRLRNFQKFWVFRFIMTQLATCSQVEALATSLLKSFRGSLRDFLVGGTSSLEKYLSLRLVRDLVQSRKTHILHFFGEFLKIFSFSLELL